MALSRNGRVAFYYPTSRRVEEIKDRFGDKKRGWGSLPVEVTVSTTTWKTSIFPDTKAQAYLLPIKADVRKKEGIAANTAVTLLLEIRV